MQLLLEYGLKIASSTMFPSRLEIHLKNEMQKIQYVLRIDFAFQTTEVVRSQ
jgi:hypothetical protein